MTLAETERHAGWTLSAVAVGLPGSALPRPDAPLSDAVWRVLVQGMRSEHLTGLLLEAVDSGLWPATDEQRAGLLDLHITVLGQTLLLDRTLLDVTRALDEAGIEVRVLKGAAVAHLDYADPGLRAFGDVDLLVRSEDADRLEAVLTGLGARRDQPAARPGFDRKFGKSFTYVLPGGHEIDVHRTFVMGPYGLAVDLDGLWASHAVFSLGEQALTALPDEARILHAAFGAVLSDWPPRLRPRRDLAAMVLDGGHDPERVIALAQSWRAEAVLATAINETWQAFRLADVTGLNAWAQRYQIGSRDRRLLALYRRLDPPYSQLALHSLRLVPGLRDKTTFVSSLVLPSRDFLDRRGMSWPRYVWRGTRRALRRSPT